MKNKTIGVIGNGFVGGAVANGFKNYNPVRVYDKTLSRRTHTIDETMSSDFIFVCLPTPMKDENGGDVDLKYIFDFFKNTVIKMRAFNPIYIIKSTVPVGTTESIRKMHDDIKVVHNPEFLTAANADEDFLNAERTVVGGETEPSSEVAKLYMAHWPKTPVIVVSSDASEMIKYTANSFLALKVSYFNMIYDYCMTKNINFEDVLSGVYTDSRIGESHTHVPGPDGDRGYGGTCFPKDINAMREMFLEQGLNHDILTASWIYNKSVRENWDWADNPASVSKNSYDKE